VQDLLCEVRVQAGFGIWAINLTHGISHQRGSDIFDKIRWLKHIRDAEMSEILVWRKELMNPSLTPRKILI